MRKINHDDVVSKACVATVVEADGPVMRFDGTNSPLSVLTLRHDQVDSCGQSTKWHQRHLTSCNHTDINDINHILKTEAG